MTGVTDKQIMRVANKSKSVSSMMQKLGYKNFNPGGNTIIRFKRILGSGTYNEIAGGARNSIRMNQWNKAG